MKKISSALRIALLYFLMGISWIFITDHLTFSRVNSPEIRYQLQNWKGSLYVIITAVFLYFLVKKSTLRIKKRSKEYEILFEENPNPMWVLNTETNNFLAVNQAALMQYGYTREEFMSASAHDILQTEEYYTKYLNKTAPEEGDYIEAGHWQNIKKNGEVFWVNIFQHHIRFRKQNAILVLALNVTAQKQIEEERNKLIEELTRQNHHLQQFAYITSHNMRAPVANILGLLNLYDKNSLPEVNNEIIDNLNLAATNLDEVIRDLNSLLAVRDQVKEEQRTINLEQVTNGILQSIKNQIEESEAEIEVDFFEAPTIFSYKGYVQSILLNLLTNAIKYRSPDRKLHIQVKTHLLPDYICLVVTDNGLGINLEKYGNKLFGMYKRFHQHIDGKGLGLYLVKSQAEALGGKVEVESEKNKGATFKVYFPRS